MDAKSRLHLESPAMPLPKQFCRLATAFLISIVLNIFLFAVDFSIGPRRAELSRIQNVVLGLLRPAESLTVQFAPEGHGGIQVLALVISSILVYTVVVWLALSIPAWWRSRG